MSHDIGPYLVPLAVVAFILWRGRRAKPRKVRLRSMWIMPALIGLVAWSAISSSHFPGILGLVGYALAAAAGLGVGWLRARHMALAVHPEAGTLTSTATPIGTMLVAGLFLVRFGLKLAFPELSAHPTAHHAAGALYWTDAALLFSAGIVWGRAGTTWLRARPLLEAHAASQTVESK